MSARVLAATLLLVLAASVGAAATPPATDAELDARAHALSQELRCVVCQNQTLADSNAELAVDLRRQIRQQLADGADEKSVKDYLAQRYGDFVLYEPPLRPLTWLLWFGPFLLLVGVVATLWRARRRRARTAESSLQADERRRLDAMLQASPVKEEAP